MLCYRQMKHKTLLVLKYVFVIALWVSFLGVLDTPHEWLLLLPGWFAWGVVLAKAFKI